MSSGDGFKTPGSVTTAAGTSSPSGGSVSMPGTIDDDRSTEGDAATPAVSLFGAAELVALGTSLVGSGAPAVIKALTKHPEVAFSVNPIRWDGKDGHKEPTMFDVDLISKINTQAYLMRVEIPPKGLVEVHKLDTTPGTQAGPELMTERIVLKRGEGAMTRIRITCQNRDNKRRSFKVRYHILLLSHTDSLVIDSNLAAPRNY